MVIGVASNKKKIVYYCDVRAVLHFCYISSSFLLVVPQLMISMIGVTLIMRVMRRKGGCLV